MLARLGTVGFYAGLLALAWHYRLAVVALLEPGAAMLARLVQ